MKRFAFSRRTRTTAFFLAAALVLSSATFVAQAPRGRAGERTAADGRRADFLQRFARAYYPGRSGQLMIVPRQGDIITRPGPALAFMHGSPWPYDAAIPLLLAGPQVKPGTYTSPARQQDVAVTLASALRVPMPATATGRVLPALRPDAPRPRAVFVLVLDGTRADYFTRHAAAMPNLTALRKRGAWFSNARIDYLPTNTASGHSTVSTGADPRAHGVNGNNLFVRSTSKRHDMYAGWNPADLMALSLSDVWQFETKGEAVIVAQGGNATSSTALAGHGACQLAGIPVFHAAYDETSGAWKTNPTCFRLAPELTSLDVRTIFPADGKWLGHDVASPSAIRRSALFPRFEADAFIRTIEAQPIGDDDVPDLLLMNLKSLDYVGHQYGPESKEIGETLVEVDRQVARILAAIESKVGNEYLMALTADHGMPSEPETRDRRHYSGEVTKLLNAQFDPEDGKVIAYYEPENSQIFVDTDRLAALKLTLKDLADFLRKQPFIDAVFTEDEVRRAVLHPVP
jgi:hypothetical protein